jgi:hypothetical protein
VNENDIATFDEALNDGKSNLNEDKKNKSKNKDKDEKEGENLTDEITILNNTNIDKNAEDLTKLFNDEVNKQLNLNTNKEDILNENEKKDSGVDNFTQNINSTLTKKDLNSLKDSLANNFKDKNKEENSTNINNTKTLSKRKSTNDDKLNTNKKSISTKSKKDKKNKKHEQTLDNLFGNGGIIVITQAFNPNDIVKY